jgi:hypothetical protein
VIVHACACVRRCRCDLGTMFQSKVQGGSVQVLFVNHSVAGSCCHPSLQNAVGLVAG